MRDVVVGAHFDFFRVNDNHAHIGRGVAIEERHNESVGHDGFTRTGSTGDEKVAHIS